MTFPLKIEANKIGSSCNRLEKPAYHRTEPVAYPNPTRCHTFRADFSLGLAKGSYQLKLTTRYRQNKPKQEAPARRERRVLHRKLDDKQQHRINLMCLEVARYSSAAGTKLTNLSGEARVYVRRRW